MASKFPEEREEKEQLRTRKGHDMTWSCDKHAEPISFYCRKHKVPICHKCAIKDHQKPCQLDDIEDVILENRRKLEDTQSKIAEANERLKTLGSKIESTATSSTNHLQSVSDEVNATYEGKLQSVKDKEREEIRLINEKADEEIRIITEKRERRITTCKEEADQQQRTIKESEAKLISDIKKIKEKVKKIADELRSKHQHNNAIVDNMGSKIERLKQDDKTLVNEASQVIASLDEGVSSNVHQEVADYLDRVEREVQRVKFVEGEVGGEHYGRIDGYIGEWELVKSILISSIVNDPQVRGLISEDEIYVREVSGNALCVTNISTELTKKVIEGDSRILMWVTSCATIDGNLIVCGKGKANYKSDSLDGCITLYDRQWKTIRDITIPRNRSSLFREVCVDVDRDGMILAAEIGQSNIYVISPADGKIANTITMQGKKVCGEIQALSSGDILVKTGGKEFTVISRSGEEKAALHCDEWEWSWCYVDKLTDIIYIKYWDRERKIDAVDKVSCDGNMQARRIVEYVMSDDSNYSGTCLITPGNTLVACDGDKLLVYKKSFIV